MKWMLASLFLIFSSLNYMRTDIYPVWNIRNSGVDAEGAITEAYVTESRQSRGTPGARLTVQFTDSNGNLQSFISVQDDYSRYNHKPGSPIAVRYLSGNPRQAMTAEKAGEPLTEQTVYALGFLGLACWLGMLGIKSRKDSQ